MGMRGIVVYPGHSLRSAAWLWFPVPAGFTRLPRSPMMRTSVISLTCLVAMLGLDRGAVAAPGKALIREYNRQFTTYPYSDPDPVPTMSRFYPYFRYDGFTDTPVPKQWKVVELSNDYVQLLILPEIGGKVWAAIEKSTGKPFIYFNHVVKFRDVSMRGPWTSGGMEANYGIMGHTPNCFSPVDYVARCQPDGSVSCIIGTLDLLTRSTWRLEINLPANQAGFSTRSFWHNASGMDQPYYTWMNIGIKSAGNLQFIDPGTHYLGHDGKAFDWPINAANRRDLAWYDQNDFGPYKSYHVFGRLAEFFGGYWHDDDFGMARCSTYGDKPGRKVWIWGLSRQGMIWEKLLTDTDGQYVEVQSGRLLNQSADESTLTPFKHKEFPPYATDTWTEYWQPVKGIKGMLSASPWGAMNVTRQADRLIIRISPSRPLRDKLEVFDGTRLLHRSEVNLKPMQPFELAVPLETRALSGAADIYFTAESAGHTTKGAPLPGPLPIGWGEGEDGHGTNRNLSRALPSKDPPGQHVVTALLPRALRVCLGGDKLQFIAGDDDVLSRPTESPANFDWHSTYGLYLKGKESARERGYLQAADELNACLKTDPHFVPALVEMAALENRRAEPVRAAEFARHALSIDTYDPGANYQFGLASAALGRSVDAEDGFSIAALSIGWRSAASTELAKAYLREKRYDRALTAAEASLDNNRRNLDALQLRACLYRLQADKTKAEAATAALLELDPLNHFARCERFLRGRGGAAEFTNAIRNELPHETFLELAAWYRQVGLDQDAARVLELAPPTAEVLYWLAFLRQDAGLLARAEAASPAFVLPFRREAIPVFEWARARGGAWPPRYYLALIRWHLGDVEKARELLESCGDLPVFGPFYAARAQVREESAARRATATFAEAQDYLARTQTVEDGAARDLRKAAQLDPGEWRYGAMLSKRLLRRTDPAPALAAAGEYAQRFPTNSVLALLHAKALVLSGRNQAAVELLDSLNLIPCEGSTDAHGTFREANLMLAVERMKTGSFATALPFIARAREWPEKLGAGKPYPEDADERLEDWLACQCYLGSKASREANQALEGILAAGSKANPGGGVGAIIRALALRQAGRAAEGSRVLQDWLARNPANPLARWGVDVFAEPATPLPAGVADPALRVLAEWMKSVAKPPAGEAH